MGQRFRLKADVNISRFSAEVQVILRALKKYGMILADNGSAWYISGVPDSRWDNDALVQELSEIRGSDFEAVDVSPLMVNQDSGEAMQGGANQVPSSDSTQVPGSDPVVSGSSGSSGGGCFVFTISSW